MKFFDRNTELGLMEKNWKLSSKHSVMTTIMGRRRVGKTSLIIKSLAGQKFLYLYISKDNESVLCSKFQRKAQEQLGLNIFGAVNNFSDLFELLMNFGTKEHYTLILDEFQNLLSINPAIPSHIQDIWDRLKDKSRVNLILCGSIYSMMKRLFEGEDEPLYGRRDSAIKLAPFTTKTIKNILSDYNPNYAADDLLCLYMLTGGVAKYVSLLMDSGATNKEKMLDYALSADSPFISEGAELLVSEFGRDYGTYFSILQLIAAGMGSQSQIDGAIGKNTGAYLANLSSEYNFISRNQPLLSKPGSRNIRWCIDDCFLRFWFRFIYPYQDLIETGNIQQLRKYIDSQYELFSGKTLEQYFQHKLMETGRYTATGNWWDRKGKNEIDILAVNEFSKKILVAEVKRNAQKISLSTLVAKASQLPEDFSKYELEYKMLSLKDM